MVKFIGLLKFTELLFSYYLSQLGEDANPNVMISPMSAFTAMCMINNGARGPTRDEIQSALQLSKKNNFCEEAEKLVEFFATQGNNNFTLDMANGLFTNRSIVPLASFKKILRKKYKAESRKVAFGTPEATKIINDWVAEKTHGKIQHILGRTQPEEVLVIVNAIYMKGKWSIPFDKDWTQNGTFFAPSGEMAVDFMRETRDFKYLKSTIDGVKFKAVFLSYESGYNQLDWKMALVLPEKGSSPSDLKGLISDRIFKIYDKSSSTLLKVKIPKYKIESDIKLNPLLQQLGIQSAFTNDANFSGIHETIPTKIGQIKQKTFIAVDEEGTEAAAVTYIESVSMSADFSSPPKPKRVFFDSPYLFAIINVTKKIILFAGVVAEPHFE
ncbi:uncharacterized protein LOC142337148 [Convolutriloba macropyga]|uniref:uncharacterized protein LOC142337148 n=1 Tax=Convolutriloba macropyga TaxID=536237 RepID=UPI003F51B1FC